MGIFDFLTIRRQEQEKRRQESLDKVNRILQRRREGVTPQNVTVQDSPLNQLYSAEQAQQDRRAAINEQKARTQTGFLYGLGSGVANAAGEISRVLPVKDILMGLGKVGASFDPRIIKQRTEDRNRYLRLANQAALEEDPRKKAIMEQGLEDLKKIQAGGSVASEGARMVTGGVARLGGMGIVRKGATAVGSAAAQGGRAVLNALLRKSATNAIGFGISGAGRSLTTYEPDNPNAKREAVVNTLFSALEGAALPGADFSRQLLTRTAANAGIDTLGSIGRIIFSDPETSKAWGRGDMDTVISKLNTPEVRDQILQDVTLGLGMQAIQEKGNRDVERMIDALPKNEQSAVRSRMNLYRAGVLSSPFLSGTPAVAGLIGGKGAEDFDPIQDRAFSNVKDRQTRFQISDKDAKIKPTVADRVLSGEPQTLANVLSHKELYRRYPQVAGAEVKFGDSSQYDTGLNQITVNRDLVNNASELRKTLLHEAQHAIQAAEGFMRGGSPNDAEIRAWIADGGDGVQKEFNALKQQRPDASPEDIGREMMFRRYQSLGGEVEARSVAGSADKSLAELRSTDTFRDQLQRDQIAPEQVGVRMAGGMQAAVPDNLRPLVNEARKYKTAEEFVQNNINNVKEDKSYQLDWKNNDYFVRFSDHINEDMLRNWSSWNFGEEGITGTRKEVEQQIRDAIKKGGEDAELDISGFTLYGKENIERLWDNGDIAELYPGYWVLKDTVNASSGLSSHELPNNLEKISDALKTISDYSYRYDGTGDGVPFDANTSRVIYSGVDGRGMNYHIIEEGSGASIARSQLADLWNQANNTQYLVQRRPEQAAEIERITADNTLSNTQKADAIERILRTLPEDQQSQGRFLVDAYRNQGVMASVEKPAPANKSSRVRQMLGLEAKEGTQQGQGKAPQEAPSMTSGQPSRRQKSLLQTIAQSEQTTKPLQSQVKKVEQTYEPITNKQAISAAQKAIAEDQSKARAEVMSESPVSAEKSAMAIELVKKYEREQNYDSAIELIENYDAQLRAAGQFIQAASLWNRMSPEGVVRMTDKIAKKLNIPLDEQVKKDIFKRMQKVSKMKDGEAKDAATLDVLSYAASKLPLKKGELFESYRYQNMLSSPKTQSRNIFSNLFNVLVTRPLDIAFESTYDLVKFPFNPAARDMRMKDISEYYKSVFESVPNAMAAFAQIYKNGFDQNKLDMKRGASVIETLRQQNQPRLLTIVPRFMEASDRFFSTMLASGEYSRLIKNGESKESAKIKATKLAEKYLYREKLGSSEDNAAFVRALDSLGQFALQGRNLPVVGKPYGWMVPFVTTPINVAKEMVKKSPLGLVGKKGIPWVGLTKQEKAQALGGTAIMGLGAILAAQDRVTWGAPKDEDEREAFYASGRKPYSVQVGDSWVPLIYLGPLSLTLAIPAAIKQNYENKGQQLDDTQIEKLGNTVGEIASFIMNQTPLSGVNGFLEIISGEDVAGLDKQLGFTAGQVVPASGLLRYISNVVDPIYRKSGGFLDTIKKDIPFLSESLEAYTTPDGEPSKRRPLNALLPYDVGLVNQRFEDLLQAQREANTLDKQQQMESEDRKKRAQDLASELVTMDKSQWASFLTSQPDYDKEMRDVIKREVRSKLLTQQYEERGGQLTTDEMTIKTARYNETKAQLIWQMVLDKPKNEQVAIYKDLAAKGLLTQGVMEELAKIKANQ